MPERKLSGELSEIAWNVVNSFVVDWQRAPYRWSTEIDVQVELASRLLSEYKQIGKDTVIGNYRGAVPGFEHNQVWNRVCCEPKVYFNNREYCYPDVVVWDDILDANSPPDAEEYRNWPIIWLCEIKLDWSDMSGWDQEKMERLLAENTTQYACGLQLFRKREKEGNPPAFGRLRIYHATVPPLMEGAVPGMEGTG